MLPAFHPEVPDFAFFPKDYEGFYEPLVLPSRIFKEVLAAVLELHPCSLLFGAAALPQKFFDSNA